MFDAENELEVGTARGAAALDIVAVSVGNTNTKFGLFTGHDLIEAGAMPSDRTAELAEAIATLVKKLNPSRVRHAIVLASVNTKASQALYAKLSEKTDMGIYRVGVDLAIPLHGRLDHEAMTGQDRALNALAAFEIMKQAVVIVDAGTAITVDFIDGEGVFHGGAIAPGVNTSLRALHDYTDALPEVAFALPEPHPFGANTQQAMLNGVFYGARGLVRALVERYAEAYSGFPLVVATGGDAELLFGEDEFIDRVIPNLTLLGIVIACEHEVRDSEE